MEVVLSCGSSNTSVAFLWDLRTGTILSTYKNCSTGVNSLDVVGQDYFGAIQLDRGILAFWSWGKDQPRFKCSPPEKLRGFAISNDGIYAVAGATSGKLYLWDVGSGLLLKTWEAHYQSVSVVRFTDDGSYIISGSADSHVLAWQFDRVLEADGNPSVAHTWTQHTLEITDIACTSGGASCRVITASLDRSSKIWHLLSGTLLCSVLFPSPVTCIAVNHSETILYVGCTDGCIYGADMYSPVASSTGVTTLAIPHCFKGHTQSVVSVSCSSELLVSGSKDGTAKIWDCSTAQAIKTFTQHGGPVSCVRVVSRPRVLGSIGEEQLTTPLQPFKKQRDPEAEQSRSIPLCTIPLDFYSMPSTTNEFDALPNATTSDNLKDENEQLKLERDQWKHAATRLHGLATKTFLKT